MRQTIDRSGPRFPERLVRWRRPWVFSVALIFWAGSASGVPAGGKTDDSSRPQDASETLRYEWVSNGKGVGELT